MYNSQTLAEPSGSPYDFRRSPVPVSASPTWRSFPSPSGQSLPSRANPGRQCRGQRAQRSLRCGFAR